MAMLCYSDLEDDDRVGVSALHAALESWVLRLLVDTQDRTTRPPALPHRSRPARPRTRHWRCGPSGSSAAHRSS